MEVYTKVEEQSQKSRSKVKQDKDAALKAGQKGFHGVLLIVKMEATILIRKRDLL